MQLQTGRTALRSAQGQGGAAGLSLVTVILIYSLISVTAASLSTKILSPENNTIIDTQDKNLTITCKAETRWLRFHNIYWLVNDTFVEDAYPDSRVTEHSKGITRGKTVEQILEFGPLEVKDFRTTFTCVVQDPSGGDIRRLTLVPEKSDISKVRIIVKKDGRKRDPER
ncbi:interleukin-1 receptor type 2-like [Engystomops pustulosus]|uniref:interleukin-1 receptor type 2-like n=1 Tax=Engystomops pustulosus TaxID=76066 RepID=UPI003AFB7EA8